MDSWKILDQLAVYLTPIRLMIVLLGILLLAYGFGRADRKKEEEWKKIR